MIVSARQVYEGQIPPRWYGRAWAEPHLRAYTYLPIPINVFARWARGFYWWLVIGHRGQQERMIDAAESRGYARGYDMGRKAMPDPQAFRDGWNAAVDDVEKSLSTAWREQFPEAKPLDIGLRRLK